MCWHLYSVLSLKILDHGCVDAQVILFYIRYRIDKSNHAQSSKRGLANMNFIGHQNISTLLEDAAFLDVKESPHKSSCK